MTTPLRRVTQFLAMVAAIMLMIGGVPSVAAANACNPCPPDCEMMKADMAKADHHGKAPVSQDQTQKSCQASLACASPAIAPLPVQVEVAALAWASSAERPPLTQLAAPSRPPDRDLRPPIQI
jgi:hypothetical protein